MSPVEALRRPLQEDLSGFVGLLRRDGRIADAEEVQARSRDLGAEETRLDDEESTVAAALRDLLLRIPNIPAADAPDGAGDADNPVLRVEGFDPDAYGEHQRVPHWEIGAELASSTSSAP